MVKIINKEKNKQVSKKFFPTKDGQFFLAWFDQDGGAPSQIIFYVRGYFEVEAENMIKSSSLEV
jgi:hypothetical protein